MLWRFLTFTLAGCAFASTEGTTVIAPGVEELGDVSWTRGIDAALERAGSRPVLVLFDEVPGCSTVKGFGNGALSDPLLVEAIETLFEPVVVYNNTSEDAAICASYGEPRWNNPVLRVLSADGETVARFEGPYSEAGLAGFLVSSLGRSSPTWLSELSADLTGASRAETASYSMACFWSGEAHLAGADGVLAARTGWMNGREVVEVSFDPEVIDRSALSNHAGEAGYRPAKGKLSPTPGDDHHALKRSRYSKVAMTEGQAARVNHAVAKGMDPKPLLSPRQLASISAE